jgi:hypothetical protein
MVGMRRMAVIKEAVTSWVPILIAAVAADSQTAGPPTWAVGNSWKLSDGRELVIIRTNGGPA